MTSDYPATASRAQRNDGYLESDDVDVLGGVLQLVEHRMDGELLALAVADWIFVIGDEFSHRLLTLFAEPNLFKALTLRQITEAILFIAPQDHAGIEAGVRVEHNFKVATITISKIALNCFGILTVFEKVGAQVEGKVVVAERLGSGEFFGVADM